VAGVYGLHRLALWMETKGWIYYVHTKASPSTLGTAMLNLQTILQPGAEHVVEMRQSRRVQRNNADGPDKAGDADPKDTGTY
jgi:hypothetical protein